MSKLSNKSARKAMLYLARSYSILEKSEEQELSAADAFQIRLAKNILQGIIENNGFYIVSNRDFKVSIKKEKFR